MNATMLSGGLRSGPVRCRSLSLPSVERQPRAVGAKTDAPQAEGGENLSVAERGGVWCVLAQDGATLAPCANESTARAHAAALSRLSSLSRQ